MSKHASSEVAEVSGDPRRAAPDNLDNMPLNASDRCDRCGAQAYVRVTLHNGFDLLFCAHHSKEHADKLTIGRKMQGCAIKRFI